MLNDIEIEQELNENTERLTAFLKGVNNESALRSPAMNSWSIIETCEHILIIETAVTHIYRGKTEKADRNPTEKIEKIKYKFGDYTIKLTAGEPIKPRGEYKDIGIVSKAIADNRSVMMKLLREGGWDEICLDFSHAVFGFLTKIEWLYFCIFHAERHLHQMKAVEAKLAVRD